MNRSSPLARSGVRSDARSNLRPPRHLSVVLRTLAETAAERNRVREAPGAKTQRARPGLTLGEIVDGSPHAAFGLAIALLAILAMPVPLVSIPFGLAIALLALQMLVGRRRPWLPGFVSRSTVPAGALIWADRRFHKWAVRLEHVARPRLPALTEGMFWSACGVGVLLTGLGLTLVIPFSNLLFVVPLVIYAIGLLESDGLLVLVGHIIVATEIVLAVWVGDAVIRAIGLAFE